MDIMATAGSLFFLITNDGSLRLCFLACLKFLYSPKCCSEFLHSTEYAKGFRVVRDRSLTSSPFSPILLVLIDPGGRLNNLIILSLTMF